MPVRLLSTSVLKWSDSKTVINAMRDWVVEVLPRHQDVIKIGFFGSYARGDWGVGSDLDLVIVVKNSDLPFERRAAKWDLTGLPVPADLLVYTENEWAALDMKRRFTKMVREETVWLYTKNEKNRKSQ